MPRVIGANGFKARCLTLLDEVARTGEPLVVMKGGVPIAQVLPLEESIPRSLEGSVRFLTDDEGELFSTGESWSPKR